MSRTPRSWFTIVVLVSLPLLFGLQASQEHAARTNVSFHGAAALASIPCNAGTNESCNWSGAYAQAQSKILNGATAQWTVPRVACGKNENSTALMWVGFGHNAKTDTLYQEGTKSFCKKGTAHYVAWWEILPGSLTVLSGSTPNEYRTDHGDYIYAGVSYVATDTVQFSLADYRSNVKVWGWEQQVTDTAYAQTAECILEREQFGTQYSWLSDFDTASFANCQGSEVNYGAGELHPGGLPGVRVSILSMTNDAGAYLLDTASQSGTFPYSTSFTWKASN